jgi:putative ABC transport system permease protein
VVDVSVDWRVLLFAVAVAVCVGAGIVVGLAPALQAARVNVLEALGSGIVGARVVRTRLRHWIVIPQVALSLVLLLVAAVHVRALMRFELADLGYRTDGAIVLTIGRWEPREPIATQSQRTREEAQRAPAARVRLFNRAVLDRVASLPQVTSAAIAASLPVYSTTSELTPVVPRDDYDAGGPPRGAATRAVVSDGYFDAMGMRLLAGRRFDDRDGPYEQFGPRVAVVSEALARRLWPAGNAVGGSLAFLSDSPGQRPEWLEVVGVVNEVDPILDDVGERPQVYVPLKQEWRGSARHLVVRGAGDQAALIGDLKAAVVGADAFAEVSQVRTMEQVVGEILYPRRLAAAILTAAGGIGLLLACIGLYGVVSYSVAQRLREIGIRTTLGAERGDIVALVLREGAKVAGIGIAAGLGLAWVALRWSAGIVPDVPVMDVVSFTVVPAVLAGVVIAASVVPARRAARVDPAQVLRTG